ncbi:unnamed protein product, partial [Durusdinium trenchii]
MLTQFWVLRQTARPGGSRSRHLEADPPEGIRRNGRTKTISDESNLASAERGSPDEEARHSDGFANRRAEGWMAGGLVGRFKQNCRELKEYIEMNGKLPTATRTKGDSSGPRLATWLRKVRANGVLPERKMLEEVHPLVKELLQKRDDKAVKIDLARWKKQLEKVLHIVEKHGGLPKFTTERMLYQWLRTQLRRLDALPPELA